ncbi:stromelysin-3 isoform X1 [Penaeus vannamei]|nr:stromelysin-3-like isoform X1 [Penaeus vannamei]
MLIRKILGALSLVTLASSTPVPIAGTTTAMMYLARFGYLAPTATNPQSGALLSEETVTDAVKEFQAFAGLNQTGELDDETVKMMNTPRCGVKDKVGYGSDARKKRYALQGSRWRVRDLNYRITKYPRGLTKASVDREIAAAFKVWSDVTELSFTPVTSGKVHIEIRFEKGEHGDGDPFDGPGGTLAHAYFPIYGGDAHFDDTEAWTIDSYRGTNMFQVAAHEFGHSLGLSHSDVRSSLMAPFYRGYEPSFELDQDDLNGIQALYGKKTTKPTPATLRPPTIGGGGTDEGVTGKPSSVLCGDPSVDAIVTMSDQNTYVFKGSRYWRLTEKGVDSGYPKSISEDWDGLPSNIDAAFTWTNGKTYFFRGGEYWRFSDLTMDADYPKQISKGFSGIPDDIDAAFVWSGNGKIYFFKGSKYWRFDPTQRPPVKESYPKPISNWEGLPNSIDDALQYSNGYTYFFKDGNYWRFNDRRFKIDSGDPAFPRPAGYWWFGCPASGSQMDATQTGTTDPLADEAHDDTFDADGSEDYIDSNNWLTPRVAGSRSVGYRLNGAPSNTLALSAALTFTLVFVLQSLRWM